MNKTGAARVGSVSCAGGCRWGPIRDDVVKGPDEGPGGTLSMVPSLADLLMTRQSLCDEMVNKIDSVATDVTVIQADLRKVANHMTGKQIDILQQEVHTLRNTVSALQKVMDRLNEHIENSEWRSQRNNPRFMGFLDRV
ncbi:hypothetical protein NDU88_000388 [Pleurodeles waltl]|uniref:Uncharacterized protein n=1 Tax=Pleurodeles waltl TaxID=8319 RepID=A0AAV7VX84_PLEWA|nr:hypothetical protein NDU88_000388 [Pleurodeles waltl]